MIDEIAIFLCFFTIPVVLYNSYMSQQSFSDTKDKSICLILMMTIYLSLLFILYILFVVFDISSIKSSYFKNEIQVIVIILSIINIVVYLLFPLAYFIIQVLEEKKLNRDKHKLLPNLYVIYQVIFKFLYYLFLYGLLNLLYITYYKTISIDYSYSNISNRIVPAVLRKYSVLSGNYEVLTYFNFGILMTLGKVLMFTYLPFGMAKFVNNLLEYTKNNEKLSDDEPIRYISIEIKDVKHKGKDIKEIIIVQIYNVIKIIFTIMCFLTILTIIFTKIIIVWSKLSSNSICGVDCGLLSFRFDHNITFQNILFYFKNCPFLHYLIFLMMMGFRIYSMIISMKTKGIALFLKNFYNLNEISKDKLLTLLFWTVFFVLNIILFYDMTYVAPDYVRFFTLTRKCDFLQIDSPDCGITLYGLFYIKFSLNFIGFIYIDIFGSFVFIFSSTLWLFLLPIKTAFNLIIDEKHHFTETIRNLVKKSPIRGSNNT